MCIFIHLAFKKGRYSYERKAVLRKKNDKRRKTTSPNTTSHKQQTTNEMLTSEIHTEIISQDTTNPETTNRAAEDTTTDKVELNQTEHVKSAIESFASGNNLLFNFLSQSRPYLPTDCEKVCNKFRVFLISLRY